MKQRGFHQLKSSDVLPDSFIEVLSRLSKDLAESHPGTCVSPLSIDIRKNSTILRVNWEQNSKTGFLLIKQYSITGDISDRHSHDTAKQILETRLRKEFEVSKRLFKLLEESPHLFVSHPLACYPELLILVIEEYPGMDLSEILQRKARFFPSANTRQYLENLCRMCGEWLKFHHEKTVVPGGSDSSYLDDFPDYIDQRLRQLINSQIIPIDEPFRDDILRFLDYRIESVDRESKQTVNAHGDFAPGNVLTDGDKLVVIDLDQYGPGAILQDLSRFYHQLDMYLCNPIFRPKVIGRLQAALLDGYDPKLRIDDPLFQIMLVKHTVCHLAGLAKLSSAPAHERWYNQRILEKHIGFLKYTCL